LSTKQPFIAATMFGVRANLSYAPST
jgi:hypothetical protein